MFKRYTYTEDELLEILKSITIIVDSREKSNAHITDYFDKHNIPYIIKKLDCGDYSFKIPANEKLGIVREMTFEKEICIERKNSAEELSLCFTKTRERFKDEFTRGLKMRKYLLIENCDYSDIVTGNYKSQYNPKGYLGSIHSFDHKYDLRITWMSNKEHSPIFIYGVFYYYLKEMFN